MFNLWVCKKCFKAKPWFRMARMYRCFHDMYGYWERLYLCKRCYARMIVYPDRDTLEHYR